MWVWEFDFINTELTNKLDSGNERSYVRILWHKNNLIAQELKMYHLNEIVCGIMNENEHNIY